MLKSLLKKTEYLEGLHSLRFFAALLVLIDHSRYNLSTFDIHWLANSPFLYKGEMAVEFFFVLSGFLLTHLAIREFQRSKTINIRYFFIRRALRIFPLYYLAVFLSYFLLAYLYPLIEGGSFLSFPVGEGLIYHLLFLPNYVLAKWGGNMGALQGLWSIGVEEQFYLLFPFLMLFILKGSRWIVQVVLLTVIFFLFYWSVQNGWFFDTSEVFVRFIFNLKFHFMLFGSIFAILNFKYAEAVKAVLKNSFAQIIIWVLIGYTIGFVEDHIDPFKISHGLIFALFILMISIKENRLLNLEVKPLIYLGTISYGIYIYHPFIAYVLRWCIDSSDIMLTIITKYPLLFYSLQLCLTILIAHISYQWYESYFIRKKSKFK